MKIDDELKAHPELTTPRPAGSMTPKLSDAELITMAVMQALLTFRSERRWLRYLAKHLLPPFPYQPKQAGYNKRLRAALPLIKHFIRALAFDTDFWFDNHWILDSTPVECGRSRPTVQRSDAAGWASYGYCASHSRFFWGLRLYLICTPAGMPILWALAGAKIGEREVVAAMLDRDAHLIAERVGLLLITDKGFAGKEFEADLARQGINLLRPNRKKEKTRPGQALLKSIRQLIESVNDTLKGQLDLELHGGRSLEGIAVRVAQRLLAMAAAIWHNHKNRPAHYPQSDRLRSLEPQPRPGVTRLGAGGHKCHAWSVEGSDAELLFRHKRAGSWAVGGIYTVTVTRGDGKVYLHDPRSARFTGRIDDQTQRARLEAADLATRTHLAAVAFERKAKADPALDQALAPLLAVAAQLPSQLQVRALLAYVTEKVHSARWRPR